MGTDTSSTWSRTTYLPDGTLDERLFLVTYWTRASRKFSESNLSSRRSGRRHLRGVSLEYRS